jgi:hypothetical protein
MAGSGLRDWWAVSHPKSVEGEEVGLLVAPVGTLMSSRPGGFSVLAGIFPIEGLRGLPTFEDLCSDEMFFVGEAEGIS